MNYEKRYVFAVCGGGNLIIDYHRGQGRIHWRMSEPWQNVSVDELFSALYQCAELREDLKNHRREGEWFTDLREGVQVVVSNTYGQYKVAQVFRYQDVDDIENSDLIGGACWIRDIYDVLADWIKHDYKVETALTWEITEQYNKDVARLNSAESWSPNMGFDLDDLEYQDVDEDILYQ